jgi:hypothetical protein
MPSRKPGGFFLFHNNGLSLAYLALFLACVGGQALAGFRVENEERQEHSHPSIGFAGYLKSSHFWQALAENWESEFLQMGSYVILTIFLFQKGSSESKDPEKENETDKEPEPGKAPSDAPWPVRVGGPILSLYRNSLGLAFLALFAASFVLHAYSGVGKHNAQETLHGGRTMNVREFMFSSEFWFESMQNWQSEFLAVFCMVVLSIFLRQKGSPESKPLAAPHRATGK